jgi:phosphoribosylanthranilate isomerase
MLTRIYEVSALEEARSISEIGVDHMRVLDGNGEFPRELSLETAAKVAAAVIAPWKVSALFLTADMALIEEWARQLQPAILHLGAAPELLSLEDAAMLKAKLSGILLMRSIPVIGGDQHRHCPERDRRFLAPGQPSRSDSQIGALGVTHDWSISRRIVEVVRTPS